MDFKREARYDSSTSSLGPMLLAIMAIEDDRLLLMPALTRLELQGGQHPKGI